MGVGQNVAIESVAHVETANEAAERAHFGDRFRQVRAETERRAALLSDEDQTVQSMPDASPAKWHRGHTTWFFETFLLKTFAANYRAFDERFAFLFNSYYVAAGPRHERPRRGLLTRPSVVEISEYRAHVDAAVERLVASAATPSLASFAEVLEIGLHHEQQHQELMLTDILHAFAQNPISPAYDPNWRMPRTERRPGFADVPEDVHVIGHVGRGFSFDNEGPPHRELVGPVRIGRALVTNGAWLEFMRDDGYETPSLWLSDGWASAIAEGWKAPGYWRESGGEWCAMTLAGLCPVDRDAPVLHVSYYEADAFARWAGKALPSEAEWEVAAQADVIGDAFGIAWQWTRSAYLPYPGFRATSDALGEYNGKFMINQMVLRGSSFATPAHHGRATYRNFFDPAARWQFTGVRLAEPPESRELNRCSR